MLKNKGAMFGLDARIALAIFGALSVISGAALYNAIQQARTVQLAASLSELEKAVSAYMLDTGVDVIDSADNIAPAVLSIKDLQVSSVTGWQGPYLNYETTANDYHLNFPGYGLIAITKANTTDNTREDICTALTDCYYIFSMRDIPDELKKSLDEYIDGAIDDNSGRVRYISTHLYYYSTIPLMNN